MAAWRRAPMDELRSSSFKYNARMSIALVPCIALMLGMGGKPVSATLTVGLMISYILDSLLLKRGAFFGIWGTLGATSLAYLIHGIASSAPSAWTLRALSFLVLMELIFLVGVWASLQFKWLHLENPSVVLALERLLFACTPFVAATCQTWGVVAAIGLEHSAFYLMGIQFLLYWFFSLPRQSSFRVKVERNYGGQIKEDARIMGSLEACLHTLMLLFLPLLLHLGIHHRRLGSLNALCELVLLFFIPLLFQLYASTRGALWWLAKDQRQLHQVRLVNGAIALIAVIVSLEIRVVFYAFNQYIQITPPLNYLLVTSAFLAAAAAIGLYLLGNVGNTFLCILLVVASTSSSVVVGMPLKFLPAPIMSALFLAHYIAAKNLISYLMFIISASVSLAWFVVHNFWFLSIWVGGTPVKTICKLIIASAILALSIPGLITLRGRARYLSDISLIGHAMLVCSLENKLYNNTSMFYFIADEDVVYPSYMVVVSTIIGLLLTRRMAGCNAISSWGAWLLSCLYTCKLSVLLLSTRNSLWTSAFLLLAISPPVLLYKQKASRMKPWQGAAHAALVSLSVWCCRAPVAEAIRWWSGRPPSATVLLGCVTLLTGLGSAPIVVYHFNHIQAARRSLMLVLATGLLCVFLQPPLPKVISRWLSHDPVYTSLLDQLGDDEAIYGDIATVPTWSTWLLLLTIVASLAAVSSAFPIQHFVALRFVYALGVGANLGIYISTRYFGELLVLDAFLVVALICASVVLVFLLLPSVSSPRLVPWVFGLLVGLLPVMYMLEGQLRGWETGEEERLVSTLALRGARSSLLGLYAAIFMLIALVVKLQLSSILKEKASQGGFVPKHRLIQQQRASQHISPLTVKKLDAEGAWTPVLGNVSTVLCFIICIVLNKHMTGGSDRAILLLAPILLLLNQDMNLLTSFGDRQRYLPLSAAVSVYLTMSAAHRVWGEMWEGRAWGVDVGGAGLLYALKNSLLLALTLPSHALFNLFMWNQVRQSSLALLLTSPLSVPAIIATDVPSVRGLALMGIIYALIQFLVSRRIRIAGMKYI